MKTQGEVTAARRARFIGYIKDKRVLSEIAVREGLEVDYTTRLRLEIAREEGLKLPRDTRALDEIGYGMDDESSVMRFRLSHKLWLLTEGEGGKGIYSRPELASLVGIPVKAQKKIMEKPYPWAWTLGQMQRLARLEGKPFNQFIAEING